MLEDASRCHGFAQVEYRKTADDPGGAVTAIIEVLMREPS
jgi:hypothetical protein